tara:strand:- start:985 stop:1527 length:543 start_codon:yes stop_codon:yes gene_type:complete
MGLGLLSMILCHVVALYDMPNAETACKNMDHIVKYSYENDIQPETLISLIYYESRWTPHVVSKSGACGLTQVLPKYTKGTLGKHLSCKDLKDPETSIKAGATILSSHLKHYDDNLNLALCAYNRGRKNCKSLFIKRKGNSYSRKIKGHAAQVKEGRYDTMDCLDQDECCIDPQWHVPIHY